MGFVGGPQIGLVEKGQAYPLEENRLGKSQRRGTCLFLSPFPFGTPTPSFPPSLSNRVLFFPQNYLSSRPCAAFKLTATTAFDSFCLSFNAQDYRSCLQSANAAQRPDLDQPTPSPALHLQGSLNPPRGSNAEGPIARRLQSSFSVDESVPDSRVVDIEASLNTVRLHSSFPSFTFFPLAFLDPSPRLGRYSAVLPSPSRSVPVMLRPFALETLFSSRSNFDPLFFLHFYSHKYSY